MPTNLASKAADVRKIPLSDVLSSRGFRKEGNSTMWTGSDQAINVTGDALWCDHKSGRRGVGTIDLVMHLDQLTFREAVNSLVECHCRRAVDKPATVIPSPEDLCQEAKKRHTRRL